MNQLPHLSDTFRQYHYIPEEIFDEILHDIELHREIQRGMPVNDKVMNRHSCMILGQNSHLQHRNMRAEDDLSRKLSDKRNKEKKELERQRNKSNRNKKVCANWECLSNVPMNNQWLKCPHRYCKKYVVVVKTACQVLKDTLTQESKKKKVDLIFIF